MSLKDEKETTEETIEETTEVEVDHSTEKAEDTSADKGKSTEVDETDSTEGQLIDVPGLGKVSALEVLEWHTDSKHKKDWRRTMNEEGKDANELKRQLEDHKRQLNDLRTQIATPKEPLEDWRKEEDPDKREKLFFAETAGHIQSLKNDIADLKGKNVTADEAKTQKANSEYGDNTINSAVEQYGIEGNAKANLFISSRIAMGLFELGKETGTDKNWSPGVIAELAENARADVMELIGAKETYVEKKRRSSGQKPFKKGKTPTKKVIKFHAGMTQREKMEAMDSDPNLPPV